MTRKKTAFAKKTELQKILKEPVKHMSVEIGKLGGGCGYDKTVTVYVRRAKWMETLHFCPKCLVVSVYSGSKIKMEGN